MFRLKKFKYEKIGRIMLYVLLDFICVDFSLLVSIGLWFDGSIPGGIKTDIPDSLWIWFVIMTVFIPVINIIIYYLFRFYNNLWEYAAAEDIFRMIIANVFTFVATFIFDFLFLREFELIIVPKRMLLVAMCVNMMFFIFSRFGGRMLKRSASLLGKFISDKTGCKRVLIVGAGKSGNEVIKKIAKGEGNFKNRIVVLAVDDDIEKNENIINGVRVANDIMRIPRFAEEYKIDEIIIAIPSATNAQIRRIVNCCAETNCVLKIIPPISDISSGFYNKLRDVKISDLLAREEINIDVDSISGYIKSKSVLVTGGGGSIGSELCRQIAKFFPEKIVIFDIYENNAFELMRELKQKYDNIEIILKIGSVCDEKCIENLFSEFKPDAVFHAAAHKHVCLMEDCPEEAVKNNVFGTMNVAKAADRHNVRTFVLLSTDKAVNPTSVMGATKRITELLVQQIAENSNTKYTAVRFGNVLGSNGSVIPIFQKQISEGGPVTVTHKNVVRYFMTVAEAARLVLQAGGMGKSGRIFVLDMGEPVKIYDLAKNLIRLSGFTPEKEIQITFTGLKKGEKLYEELIMDEEREGLKVTYHNKIFITKPVDMNYELFDSQLSRLRAIVFENPSQTIDVLCEILPNFKCEG